MAHQSVYEDGSSSASFRIDGVPTGLSNSAEALPPALSINPSYAPLNMPHQADHQPLDLDHNMPFSPHDAVWEANGFSTGHDNEARQPPNHPSFMAPDAAYSSHIDDTATPWRLDGFAGVATPTAAFDGVPNPFDPNTPATYIPSPISSYDAPAFSHQPLYGGVPQGPIYEMENQPYHALPLSPPQSGSDWMVIAMQEEEEEEEEVEIPEAPKRIRISTPKAGPLRRDGVRKKNARFEIPEERNLVTIDYMITKASNENDDELVKQLRQQKRLLRNREAALQSRQRKKNHTEQLEGEKKGYLAQIDDLHEAITARDNHIHQQKSRLDQLLERIHGLEYEKEVQAEEYTLDTGRLRKQVSVLQEQLQALQNAPMPAASSTHNSATFNHDLSQIGIGTEDWDGDFDILEEYLLEPRPALANAPSNPLHVPDTLPTSANYGATPNKEGEKSAASGVLLMLLLYGAFFVSNSKNGASNLSPKIPKDLQMASLTVLDNVFKDAGIPLTERMLSPQASQSNLNEAAAPTSNCHPSKQQTRPQNQLSGLEPQSSTKLDQLTRLHENLTTPTKAQEAERAFAVTPEQFNRMTSHERTHHQRPETFAKFDTSDCATGPKRTLAASLASMRLDNQGSSAADVYTRSLLYDEIKPEIVLEFKKMVETSQRLRRKASNEAAE